jgi:hypothetical protein
MSNYQISYADLTGIKSSLRSMEHNFSVVHSELNNIDFKQDQLESELLRLANAFAEFVELDAKQKAAQMAETRVGNLRQELQIKYGYYAEIRRMAIGILQGVDTGIVSEETLKSTTEEVMIKAPGYWLAPALVALSAWISNDKETSDKAIAESLKRDDYKTSFFLMLVMRRLKRNDAALKWLERYFMHQNPHHLDREFIIILEAVTTGVFPPAARQLMMQNVKSWLEQLTQSDTFIEQQKSQWVKFFEATKPVEHTNFILLEKYSSNWDSLKNSLDEVKSHAILHSHFNRIISSSADFSKAVKVQLDEILSLLVSNFDDEELPLQKQVRLNQLIIEKDGDKHAAQAILDSEEHIFEEKVDFLQLLTNASFNPELSGATTATQALAVSISQPWIVEAHDTFTANSRNRIPQKVELDIDGWKSHTATGSDENEKVAEQEKYYQDTLTAELEKLSFPYGNIIIGALIGLGGIWAGISFHGILALIGIGIGGVMIWNNLKNHKKTKDLITKSVEERHIKSKEVLRGCLAETVDYRKEHTLEDARAEDVRELLASITPEDFSSVSKETARSIV